MRLGQAVRPCSSWSRTSQRAGHSKGSRALSPFRQAVLVLRWFRERGCVRCLARDPGISQATGYRYLHKRIDVLADQAPDLPQVLNHYQHEDMTHTILDGTLITCDRIAGVGENGNDLWFSQKHKAFCGNIQFLSAPDGTPLWVFNVEPGSTPRHHRRPHPHPARPVQGSRQGPTDLGEQGLPGRRCRRAHPCQAPHGQERHRGRLG